MNLTKGWKRFLGKDVVVDTDSSLTYIGRFSKVDYTFLIMTAVDVRDRSEGVATKERYVMEARKFGVRANRETVLVRLNRVVSISLLKDVIEY